MSEGALTWIGERPPLWDEAKERIIGGAPAGIFDRRYASIPLGERVPGTWWRAEQGGETVGFGWLDIVWGDGEILLAVDPAARTGGIGTFIMDQLEAEALERGINYVYNVVRPSHPDAQALTAWLQKRGFKASEDGSLMRAVTRPSG